MFWLEPRPELAHPQRGSPRMFRVDWIEKHLSRVRPWHVVVVWLPVLLAFLASAARDPALSPLEMAAGVLGGLAFWTLLEYVLHRWVFHFQPRPGSELQSDLSFLIHGVHHDWPHDADRLVMPPVVAVVIALAVGLPMRAALGGTWFAPAFAGLLAGYLWYDLTHYATHHLRPRTALGEMQRRNHMVHHFKHPHQLFGVTTPLWDFVFRTWPKEAMRSPSSAGQA
ncbi:MAG TPA: sterol desaturase family protein [Anaeromyxobacteraceae bacterium]|nr:sterol desaturase family protein [Anaeromyxobacteraceae bacterium]